MIDYDTIREINEEIDVGNSDVLYIKNLSDEEIEALKEQVKLGTAIELFENNELVAYEVFHEEPDFTGATEGDR